jgi:uncharacterized protein
MNSDRYELPRHECVDLLTRHSIGRLSIIDHDCPVAFPVNYRFDGSTAQPKVILRTAPDTLIGRYLGQASLEIDHIDLEAGTAWSVIVRGTLKHVLGTHDLPDPSPILDGRNRWLVLETSAISGRRFALSHASDGYPVDWQLVAN